MRHILIDTSPLANDNAHRGVGAYTRLLIEQLQQSDKLQLYTSGVGVPPGVKIDLVHYPFFDLFFPTLPFFKKTKTVVTVHDVIPLKFPDHYRPGKKGSLNLIRQSLAVRKADAIITDSESSKSDIHHFLKISNSKIFTIPLAANPELKKTDRETTRQVMTELDMPSDYILYVGDINYNKNIPQLIKSLKYLPDSLFLVCVGKNFKPQNIPEWQWIETQIALSDVSHRIKFIPDLGSQATKQLSAIYTGAQAYVQPSLYEGFGLPLLEAMQCRVPVVSSNTSSLPEVSGGQAVMVDPTAEALADGVKQVLEWSDSKHERLIRDAYTWAQHFSWEKSALATIEVYEQVISTKK